MTNIPYKKIIKRKLKYLDKLYTENIRRTSTQIKRAQTDR